MMRSSHRSRPMMKSNLAVQRRCSYTGAMKNLRTFVHSAGKTDLFSASLLGVTLAPVRATAQLFGQQQRGPVQRLVQGKITDHSNAAVKGAVVYLKDGRSLAVKSYISDDQGEYRFGQLAQNTDYEIWAEHNGKKSSVKTISSFDNKNQFNINLKIED